MMSLSTTAQTVEQARQMLLDGDYATALPIFEKALAAKPKDGTLNQWVGVCLVRTGKPVKAERYLKIADERKVAEAPRYLAEAAIMQYKFSEANDLLDRYEQTMRKAKKTVSAETDGLRQRASLGQSMLDRVEKITIIDSLAVDREEFFKAYHLSPESGTINSTDVMPDNYEVANPSAVYMTQSGDLRIWAAPDKDENYILMGATRLIDGSWDTPYQLGSALNNDGDCNYPFMMPDGVTLYYANNGAESLGGYDIFISRKDDNGFLKPQNVGMPYNSADDDYLLAIDEVNGIGWWATDRNHLGDKITIYRFIPSELRVNYPVDEPKLISYARINSYRDTWAEGADYSELLSRVDSADYASGAQANDFYFALPGNKIITSWDELSTAAARTAMEEYLEAKAILEGKIATLGELRQSYATGDHSISGQITTLEREVENGYTALRNLSNKVVRANGESR
jgi:tetratricopeptide (TPR) repeat protein